ncbi:uncharacterized protein LOC143265397 [Megachile rotundata]|uniref:uncharacterized protein LOC143265397 n=1 Tax=Megachile rotundata TaxID=143995 RepID=UPI003FD5ADFF
MVKDNIKVRKTGVYLENDNKWENMYVEVETEKGGLEIVLVYRRPGIGVNREDCRRLLRNGRRDVKRIFVGDFNAKSRSWNCENGDIVGEMLEEVLDEEEMVVVNFGTLSRIGRPDQVASNLDLIIAPADIALDIQARETGETLGSDHQVIEFRLDEELGIVEERMSNRRYRVEKIDKVEFLKWMIRSEEEVLGIVRSDRKTEVKCEEMVRMLGEGIERCYRKEGGSKGAGGVRVGTGSNRVNNRKKRVKRQPWWDNECEELKEERRKATKEMGRRPSEENWNKLIEVRGRMKNTIKKKKREAWEEFISGIRHKGNIGEMWKKIRSLTKGVMTEEQCNMGMWEVQKMEEEEVRKLVESEYCRRCEEREEDGGEMTGEERNEENTRTTNETEEEEGEEEEERWITRDLEMEELEWALRNVKGKSAPGEDGIGYDVLKWCTGGWKEAILSMYNEVWRGRAVPASWKKAIVKFIPKPQKRALRPISLMNCIGKLMEKMVNERLRIWAEEEKKMDNNQNGFRKGRSTMDNISILVNGIRESWGKGKKVVAAFVDVKAAYDNVRHEEMTRRLRELNCPGRIRKYIGEWLEKRKIVIRTLGGGAMEMELLKGLPQGSVLSPLLYNLYTVGIVGGLRERGVRILQYADDIAIFVECEGKREGKEKMEEALVRLKRNLEEIGMTIAAEKTQIVRFNGKKSRGRMGREEFFVEGERIEKVEVAKFLGMWIDGGLEFRKHADYVVTKLRKRMNILKCMGGIRKGVGPDTMLKAFCALIRSVIEYGAQFYMNNRKNREKVQKIHNAGIRIAMGYRMSTPINVMETEAGIMDLKARLETLSEWYIARKYWMNDTEVLGAIENRIRNDRVEEIEEGRDMVVDAWRRFEGVRVGMSRRVRGEYEGEWRGYRMEKCLEMETGKVFERGGINEIDLLGEIKLKMFGGLENVIEIYTDGSRMEVRKKGGGAIVVRRGRDEWEEEMFTAPGQCSVYTIEMTAIGRAIERANERYERENVIVLSDSLSTIVKLAKDERGQDEGDVVDMIRNNIKRRNAEVEKRGGRVGKLAVAWIPAHKGIEGNERADKVAKEATRGDPDYWVKFTLKDFRRIVREKGWERSRERQLRQGEFKGRKYFESKWNNVGKDFPWFRGLGDLRRDTVRSLNRIRANHYNLRWSLFRKFMVDDPYCEVCDRVEDVEHLLWECEKYREERREMIGRMRGCGIVEGCDFYETKEWGEPKPLRLMGAFIKKCGVKL